MESGIDNLHDFQDETGKNRLVFNKDYAECMRATGRILSAKPRKRHGRRESLWWCPPGYNISNVSQEHVAVLAGASRSR